MSQELEENSQRGRNKTKDDSYNSYDYLNSHVMNNFVNTFFRSYKYANTKMWIKFSSLDLYFDPDSHRENHRNTQLYDDVPAPIVVVDHHDYFVYQTPDVFPRIQFVIHSHYFWGEEKFVAVAAEC